MRFLSHKIAFRIKNRGLLWQIKSCSPQSRRCYSVLANRTYDDAVDLLNALQTPYKILRERRDAGIRIDTTTNQHMRKCLALIGYSRRDLDKLNIVHVAGTKGKGSTCAYVDSILSQYRKSHDIPTKIGLFTSPHLIAVRERIRIDSAPISSTLFAKYFFEVWDSLESAAVVSEKPFEKPVYFRYLTLMSYHVFLQEGVDVAIYETGVGGEYDSTNIVDHLAVTGISTLGIDHTFALGETIDKIAWHKAGIQKAGVPSFTVRQVPAAMRVIQNRAEEKEVEVLKVVDIDSRLQGVKIRPDALFQKSNASLAVALAETVLTKLDPDFKASPNSLPEEFVNGLEQVVWRGRCEKKAEGNITWYLDGAHTADSIKVAAKWYRDECSQRPGTRVLIFNQQGHREALQLMEGLYNAINAQGTMKFDHVIFCTNAPRKEAASLNRDFVDLGYDLDAITGLTMQKSFAEKWRVLDPESHTTIKVFPVLEDAFDYVKKLDSDAGRKEASREEGSKEIHAIITGSVHLVGRALSVLEGVDAL